MKNNPLLPSKDKAQDEDLSLLVNNEVTNSVQKPESPVLEKQLESVKDTNKVPEKRLTVAETLRNPLEHDFKPNVQLKSNSKKIQKSQ